LTEPRFHAYAILAFFGHAYYAAQAVNFGWLHIKKCLSHIGLVPWQVWYFYHKTNNSVDFWLLTAGLWVLRSSEEGGVRVCGDAVLRYFWCGFAVIFILTRGIAVSKH